MKKFEITKDSEGRQTIIVPDGMEVIIEDNGIMRLIEKQDIFEKMKPGDMFRHSDEIYIFKSLNKTAGEMDSITVYGYIKFGDIWDVKESVHQFTRSVRMADEDDIEILRKTYAQHCYEWKPDTLEFIKIPWVPQYGDTYFEIDDSDSGCARVEKCSFANGTPKSKFPVFPSRREAEKWAHEYDVLLNQFISRIINEADMEHSEDY